MDEPSDPQLPLKDEESAHPIATVWRQPLREIVRAFARGDYALGDGLDGVAPVSAASAEQIEAYIADYGGTLAELPDETWTTSVAEFGGSCWHLYVDLWTVESGRSDMVLAARVFEVESGYRIEVHIVYVP